jgi:hypothetical protein
MRKVRQGRDSFLILVGALWIGLIVSGFWLLAREHFTPVASSRQAGIFPSGSETQLASGKPTLLLFAHPQCPCTRATFHELDGLLEDTGNRVSIVVIFTIPNGVSPGWEQGELWKSAASTPGYHVVLDSGGITGSRGHEGDNIGLTAVESFILHGHASVSRTPVFGCSLL